MSSSGYDVSSAVIAVAVEVAGMSRYKLRLCAGIGDNASYTPGSARGISIGTLAKVAAVCGLRPSELLRRAEERVAEEKTG